MKRLFFLSALLALSPSFAAANPITYSLTYSHINANFNGILYNDTTFTVKLSGDTSNVSTIGLNTYVFTSPATYAITGGPSGALSGPFTIRFVQDAGSIDLSNGGVSITGQSFGELYTIRYALVTPVSTTNMSAGFHGGFSLASGGFVSLTKADFRTSTVTFAADTVPEPSGLVMAGIAGAVGLGLARRMKKPRR